MLPLRVSEGAHDASNMKEYQRILIMDVGSTKADCAFIDKGGDNIVRFSSGGLNALAADDGKVNLFLNETASSIPQNMQPDSVFFYGAGCSTPQICRDLEAKIASRFDCDKVYVESDLLGATRSLLGNSAGIACILGTGSNSCLYNGSQIIDQVPSLGYVLGDEGGGVALGKRLLGDYFKCMLPSDLHIEFDEEYHLAMADVLENVYRNNTPGKFIASFVPFIKRHESHIYMKNMLQEEFTRFFVRNVGGYEDSHHYPICFTGGVAYNFSDQLREVANNLHYSIAKISNRPMDDLIGFHFNKD